MSRIEGLVDWGTIPKPEGWDEGEEEEEEGKLDDADESVRVVQNGHASNEPEK
jgi:hypothetical protein